MLLTMLKDEGTSHPRLAVWVVFLLSVFIWQYPVGIDLATVFSVKAAAPTEISPASISCILILFAAYQMIRHAVGFELRKRPNPIALEELRSSVSLRIEELSKALTTTSDTLKSVSASSTDDAVRSLAGEIEAFSDAIGTHCKTGEMLAGVLSKGSCKIINDFSKSIEERDRLHDKNYMDLFSVLEWHKGQREKVDRWQGTLSDSATSLREEEVRVEELIKRCAAVLHARQRAHDHLINLAETLGQSVEDQLAGQRLDDFLFQFLLPQLLLSVAISCSISSLIAASLKEYAFILAGSTLTVLALSWGIRWAMRRYVAMVANVG